MPPTNTTERLADYEQQYRELAAATRDASA